MILTRSSTLRFASTLTLDTEPGTAALALVDGVRRALGNHAIDLAILFVSAQYGRHLHTLSSALRQELNPRMLVGCTGEGVIGGRKEVEAEPAATLWAAHMPGVHIAPLRLSFSELHDRFTMEEWPDSLPTGGERPVFMLFADPFSTPMQEVLTLVEDRYPGAIAIGGLAGGGQDLGDNRLLLNEGVHNAGLVGVAITGNISIRTVVSQGCRPIGERYMITKAQHNVVHELSGIPALTCLQNVFGSLTNDEQALAHRALHIGIAIDEHRSRFDRGDFLVRNLIGADQQTGAVVIGDVVQEGQTVQFQVRDAQAATDDLNLLLAAARGQERSTLGALLFSCCGRGKGLFGCADHDISVVEDHLGHVPVSGFFAQGEIGPVGGRSFIHGYTASLALFGDPPPGTSANS
ncbi:MAG: FIST N-terminal domain-containing protein [Nitrospiraceae bacterium]